MNLPPLWIQSIFPNEHWPWPLPFYESSQALDRFIQNEYQTYRIHPWFNLIFNAFKLTPLQSVKVVILGQDPYPSMYSYPDIFGNKIWTPKATGLAFSVPPTCPIPRSLQNIFKELDLEGNGYTRPINGSLEGWARQGVLLLNSALTVRHKKKKEHVTDTSDNLKNTWKTDEAVVMQKHASFAELNADVKNPDSVTSDQDVLNKEA